jgi:hypothetical protein
MKSIPSALLFALVVEGVAAADFVDTAEVISSTPEGYQYRD